MSREYIARTLKKLRENSGYTADQVGRMVGKSGKTVNAWENNRGQPDAELLMQLCDIYGVSDVLAEFQEDKIGNMVLTEKEKILISHYRANPQMQSAVDRLLGIGETKVEKLPDRPTIKMSAAAHGGASTSQELTPEEYENWIKIRDGERPE